VLGQRDTSSIRMVLPKIRSAQDLGKAAEKVTQAVGRGKITPTEGEKMMGILESHSRIIETMDLESRVQTLEENMAAAPVSGPKIPGFPDQAQAISPRQKRAS
jgi:hypothetical protein